MKNKKSCSCLNRLVNINYSSKAKFLLLIPVIIIALAVMITSIFGLNFARDLQVKYEMNIDFVAELEEDKIIEYQDKIADALAEQNLQINDIRKSGKNNIYTGFAITIDYSEDFTEEEIADLQEAIELDLQASIVNTIEVSEITKIQPEIMVFVIKALIALAVVLLVVFIYLWCRFNIATACAGLVNVLMTSALTFSIFGLLRLPFGYTSLAVIALSVIVSLVIFVLYFDRMRNEVMEEQVLTNNEYIAKVSSGLTCTFAPIVGFVAFILIISLLLLIFDLYAFFTGMAIAIALVAILYSLLYASTSVWALLYNKEKDQRLRNRVERQIKNVEKKKKKSNENKDDEKVIV